jgi:hypothetical protein
VPISLWSVSVIALLGMLNLANNFLADNFQFDLIFIKKIIKSNFLKKIQNQTETGSNRPVSVRFFE